MKPHMAFADISPKHDDITPTTAARAAQRSAAYFPCAHMVKTGVSN